MASVPHAMNPVETAAPVLPSAVSGACAQPEPAEQRFLIRAIDWATNRKISDAL